jgi:hypothetical protein
MTFFFSLPIRECRIVPLAAIIAQIFEPLPSLPPLRHYSPSFRATPFSAFAFHFDFADLAFAMPRHY